MEFIEALRLAMGKFWIVLKANKADVTNTTLLIVTTLAAISTTLAAIATRNSTKVSESTLIHTQNTSRRDEFNSRYTLLLEQHKEQLNVVKSYLDTTGGKVLLKELIDGTDHLTAFKTLQGHNIISPYMRVLYHLLRHISVHYVENATTVEKKLYSSTVRSLIRNDVLFLVAVNASYVIEDNKENDYGKYQRLLREFDFFEHALFFSAGDVAPGLKNDAVSTAGNKVIKAVLKNHYILLEHDKSNLSYEYENFRIPFIVSCIFDNPLHEESVLFLEGIEMLIKEKSDADNVEYITAWKNQCEQSSVFREYYGRKYFNSADSLRNEIEREWSIDPAVYQELPEVDDRYIDVYLAELKAGHPETLPDHCYIRTFGPQNIVAIKNSRDFIKDCELLLSWQKHLHYVESRDADREFIQREEKRWSDFRSAVLSQRVTG